MNLSLIALTSAKMPEFCKAPRGFLAKSHAECDYNKTTKRLDPRSNKLCIIMPANAREIELKCGAGKTIAKARNYGKFQDGKRFRYYFDKFGFQISELARKSSGGPHVAVIANGKKVAVFNPTFRENEYRK